MIIDVLGGYLHLSLTGMSGDVWGRGAQFLHMRKQGKRVRGT